MDSVTAHYQVFIKEVALLALNYGVRKKSKDAGSLGTRLMLISNGLEVTNPNALINDDMPELSKFIAKLKSIFQVRDVLITYGTSSFPPVLTIEFV